MRRKPFRKQAVSVALFPFLAVLICTMGSLILLLVILVQHARVEADTIKAEKSPPPDAIKELQQQREDAQWRTDLLLQARQENVEQLSRARLELSHLDEHLRQLHDRWQQLNQQVEELDQLGASRQTDTAAARDEMARLEEAAAAAQKELESARQRADDQPRSFSIVPMPRKNGTLRRPIYVECTAGGVILQPEGIVLGPRDFVQPLGPGNALDTALRATREYLARHGGVSQHGEPYPLLLVRPDGAVAYAAAREALRSWDDEFGYELLDADMQLAYPETDTALANEVRRAVDLARRRQQALAASAPTRYRQLLQQERGDQLGGQFPRAGRREGLGADGTGSQTLPRAAGSLNDEPRGGGGQAPPGRQSAAQDGSQGIARREAAGQENPQAAPSSKPGPQTATGGGNGGPLESMADQRGQNWALNGGKGPRANAYTRPLRVACSAEQLVVYPEPRSNERFQILAFDGATSENIDNLVAVVKRRVEQWGNPPLRGYWHPVLSVEVSPGGERRFQDLRKLLAGSGLDVERR